MIARELIAKKRREEKADSTIGKMEWLLRLAEPALGSRLIRDVSAAEILVVLQQHEQRGHFVTAQHLRGFIGQVFRFAVSTARAENDPTYALRGALTVSKVTHHPALTEPKAFGRLLLAIDSYQGRAPELTLLLQLLALTFVRPGELRAAEWSEFSLDAPEPVWTIPATRMKGRREHRVYLAPQALAILRDELRPLTGAGRYLFPCTYGRRDRPMAANAINGALARLGYSSKEVTPHGFRASFSSMAYGSGLWSGDAIEAQLAHVAHRSAVRRAYDRDERWPERRKLMIWWANECDRLRAEAGSTL